ncbi:MAG: CapA family protein [Patescibacteria group bacterium]|nr:CapA family protein [Patescibacteria group bacterium]
MNFFEKNKDQNMQTKNKFSRYFKYFLITGLIFFIILETVWAYYYSQRLMQEDVFSAQANSYYLLDNKNRVKQLENELAKRNREDSKLQDILFVGDIMLDRGVERLMNKNSIFYPFEKISNFLQEIDFVVGNLEGPIVENPPNFPDSSLRFAFYPNVTEALSSANFSLLSLANNHTCNMSNAGLEETREILEKANIDFMGGPIECDEHSLFKKDDIIFLSFNKTFYFNCSDDEIVEIVKDVKMVNPEIFLIIFIHWGEEYHLVNSFFQQDFARKMIDQGADLIIGAHPHVVQNIEKYKGKLIFYSLGNFVFDMYFSEETQEGLAVGLEIYEKKITYKLFPIESHLSQPFLMKAEKANEFLEKLSLRSSMELLEQIQKGKIEIETTK